MDQIPPQQPPQNPYQQQPYPAPQQNPYQQPYPAQLSQPPKPKRRGCLIGGIISALVVVAIVVIAAAANGHANTGNTGTLANTTSNTPQSTTVSNSTFKVGDVVTVGTTWQITVNNVKTAPGGEFDTLKSGDTYLEISVTLKNISPQEQDVSSELSWTLKDSTGQTYNETIVSNAPSTPDGKVAAGDKLTGTLSYEVPLTQKQFEFAFSPDITSSGQTIWNLSVK